MKALWFHTPVINPIYRDLILIMMAGILLSVVLVTAGYLIIAQIATP